MDFKCLVAKKLKVNLVNAIVFMKKQSKTKNGATTLSITTLSIMTLSITIINATYIDTDVIMLSVTNKNISLNVVYSKNKLSCDRNVCCKTGHS